MTDPTLQNLLLITRQPIRHFPLDGGGFGNLAVGGVSADSRYASSHVHITRLGDDGEELLPFRFCKTSQFSLTCYAIGGCTV